MSSIVPWTRTVVVGLAAMALLHAAPSPALEEFNRAFMFFNQGKDAGALTALAGLLERHPGYYRAYQLALECFARTNDRAGAARFFDSAAAKSHAPLAYSVFARAVSERQYFQTAHDGRYARQCFHSRPEWIGCYVLAAGMAAIDPPLLARINRLREHALRNPAIDPELELDIRTDVPCRSCGEQQRFLNAERVLQLAEQLGDVRRKIGALNSLAVFAYQRHDFELYGNLLARLRALNGNLELPLADVAADHIAAVHNREQGDAAAAVILYRRIASYYEQIGDQPNLANTLRELAQSEARAGDNESAAANFNRALAIARANQQLSLEGFALHGLAQIAAHRGDYRLGIGLAAQAFQIFSRIGHWTTAGGVAGDLGSFYQELGDFAKATSFYNRSLVSAARAGDLGERERLLIRLASISFETGNPAQAASRLRRSLRISARTGNRRFAAGARIMLASVLCAQHLPNPAFTELNAVLATVASFSDAGLEGAALNALGEAYLMVRRPTEASTAFGKALKLGTHAGVVETVLQARQGLGDVACSRGQFNEAISHYSAAVEIVESARDKLRGAEFRISYFTHKAGIFERIVDVLAARGKAREALGYAESSRARTLLDRLGGAIGPSAQPPPISTIQRAAANHNAVLLEYFLGEHRSWLWLVDANSVSVVALPRRASIEPLIDRYRTLIRTRNPAWQAAAQALFTMLIRPVAAHLPPRRTIVIVPDGALHFLPFDTLQASPDHPLLETFTITYSPSASVFAGLGSLQTTPAAMELLAVGDPLLAASPLPPASVAEVDRALDLAHGMRLCPLPNSRVEIRDIAALFPPSSVRTYLGLSASKPSLDRERLADYRRIHFSTHAFVDELRPERSGIVLTPTGGGDGVLRFPEIARMKLNAGLVVLSACQTGLGRLLRGEGIMGLQQAFLYAGASRVVASLWDVNDAATAEFMRLFYRKMRSGDSPASALRNAKLGILRSGVPAYRDPKFWAPFVLTGKP